jgi:drug/metabolite transporter (DMT)-like permease
MAAQLLFGAAPLAVAAALREQPATIIWSPTFIASLLGLALFSTALGYWLWFTLLERIPLSRANAFNFLTPFIGFGLGLAFFGERLGLAVVAGLALTALGVVLVEREGKAAAAGEG